MIIYIQYFAKNLIFFYKKDSIKYRIYLAEKFMSETRTEKYKKYRESLNEVKANSKTSEAIKNREYNVVTDKLNTTSTLPLDEVLGEINEEDETVSRKLITRKRLQIAIIIAAALLLIAGIVVFGILAWR